MDTKKLLVGTIGGGVLMYALGYLTWEVIFADFFAANAGSATGVGRESPLIWAVVLGTLSLAALVTLAIGSAGAVTLLDLPRFRGQLIVWVIIRRLRLRICRQPLWMAAPKSYGNA